jgi:transcriptional regulator with XRE-family HTH domain
MDIGYRLEERTGLLHCNISLVENGHTVPSVTTLDKIAAALEMPLYELLYDGHEPPASHRATKVEGMGNSGKDARFMQDFTKGRRGSTDDRFHAMGARSQLRHRPTIEDKSPHPLNRDRGKYRFIFAASIPCRRATLLPGCQD